MKCLACDLAPADSDEHVFPSALGGRLTYPLLCKNCNSKFGDSIDAELIRGFDALRVVLGIEGDRGQAASVRVKDDQGREFVLRSGGVPKSVEAAPVIEAREGGVLSVKVATVRAARKFVESLRRKDPGRTITHAEVHSTFPGMVQLPIAIGGDEFFRSALKTALVFAAGRGCPLDRGSLAKAWAYVCGGDGAALGIRVSIINADAPWSDASLGEVAHRVAVDVRDRLFVADVRFFGDLAISAEFNVASEVTWSEAYGIDPLTRASAFGKPAPISQPITPAHAELQSGMKKAVTTAMRIAVERMQDSAINSLIDNVMAEAFSGLAEGEVMPEDVIETLASKAAEAFTRLHFRLDSKRPAPEILEQLQGKERPT